MQVVDGDFNKEIERRETDGAKRGAVSIRHERTGNDKGDSTRCYRGVESPCVTFRLEESESRIGRYWT